MPWSRSSRLGRWLLVRVVLCRRNPVLSGQPAPQIDIRTPTAAERPQLIHRGPAADRTRRDGSSGLSHAASQASTPLRAGWDPTAESRHARRDAQDPAGLRHRPATPPRSPATHAAPASAAAATPPRPRSDATPPIPRHADRPAVRAVADARARRTISARPSAVKPSSRGRSGSSASAACRPGASDARRARRQPGKIHQDRAGQVAQPDLPRQLRQHRQVRRQMRGRLALPPGHRATGVHVDRHQRRRGMNVQSGAAGEVDVWLRQRLHLLLDRLIERPGHDAARGRRATASAWRPARCRRPPPEHPGDARANSSNAPGPTRRGHLVWTQASRQARTLAALGGAGDADRHDVALAQTRATLRCRAGTPRRRPTPKNFPPSRAPGRSPGRGEDRQHRPAAPGRQIA